MASFTEKRAIAQRHNNLPYIHAINTSIHEQTRLEVSPLTGQIKLGTAEATAVQGGEAVPIADPNERAGWLYTKALAGTEKFNYYHYSQGTSAKLLSDLSCLHSIITIDNYVSSQSLVFFNVYTQPTGVGDAGPPSFPYHSKITYSISPGEHIIVGESVQCWSIHKPNDHSGKRFVEFNTKQVEGDGLPNELIWHITVHSDSSAPVGTSILVEQVGYNLFRHHNTIQIRGALVV
tara:strand:+ start:67 stop:768 length:702 start_codon:yes stop_codon:yes gene_type:complete